MSQSTFPDQIRPRPLISCLNCAANLSEHFDENPRSAPVSFLKTCVYKLLNLFRLLFSFNLVQYLTTLKQSLKAEETFDIFL